MERLGIIKNTAGARVYFTRYLHEILIQSTYLLFPFQSPSIMKNNIDKCFINKRWAIKYDT